MANLTKISAIKAHITKPETLMEKTTRIVKEITDDESEKRQVKIAHLRKARLKKEAIAVAHKTRPSRTITK